VNRFPRPLTVAAVALAATTLAGCSMTADQGIATAQQYAPADGTQTDLDGGVGVRNAMFLSDGEDAPGILVATFVNEGSEDVTVTVSGEGIDGEVKVPAFDAVMVGPEGDEEITVPQMGARAGELVTLQISTEGAAGELAVPVLDGTQEEFTDLVPTATQTTA
jgi:hypothetical protein